MLYNLDLVFKSFVDAIVTQIQYSQIQLETFEPNDMQLNY